MSRFVSMLVMLLQVSCAAEAGLGGGDGSTGSEPEGSDPSEAPSEEYPDRLTTGACAVSASECEGLALGQRPGRLSEHAAVYDDDARRMYVFGGTDSIPRECAFSVAASFNSDLWVFHDACGVWERVDASGDLPSARGRHMMAWADGALWLFGGRFRQAGSTSGAYTLYQDLHRFDPEQERWEQLNPSGAPPDARTNGSLVYDPDGKRLLLFGGNLSTSGARYTPANHLWSYSLEDNAWAELDPGAAASSGSHPSPRLFHAAAFDSQRGQMVVFGGADETGFLDTAVYFSDLWAWRVAEQEWIQLGDGGPAGRFWPTLISRPQAGDYTLFGGHDAGALGNRNDTWRFDPDASRWQQFGSEDAFNVPARGFCDFPPEFTVVDHTQPERRNAHSLVWSEACEHAILFGGKTDCGSTDDVWRLIDDGWSQLLGATEGEVCHRWRDDRSACTDMCF